MVTKKDRKIANLKIMVANRDKLIERQTNKIVKLENLTEQIRVIVNSNDYSNPRIYLDKIKELVRPSNQY